MKKIIALALVAVMALATLTACPKKEPEGAGRYTYQDYTTLSPSKNADKYYTKYKHPPKKTRKK